MEQQWMPLPDIGVPTLHGEFVVRQRGARYWRIAHWRDGFGCERRLPGRWVPAKRDPGLLLAWPWRWGPTLREFMSAVPRSCLETAAQFEYCQFTALRMMSLAPGVEDLAQDCPALFWMLADLAGSGEFDCQEAAEWALRPRREIIRLFLGEGCVYSPTFLRKVRPLLYSEGVFLRLRMFLQFYRTNPDALHLRRVVPDCFPVGLAAAQGLSEKCYFLRALGQTGEGYMLQERLETMLTEAGMIEASRGEAPYRVGKNGVVSIPTDAPSPGEMLAFWLDVQRIAVGLERWDMLEALQRAESHARVRDLRDQALGLYNRSLRETFHAGDPLARVKAIPGNIFPPPPLPGNKHIKPILTVEELKEEGRIMRHCAADMAMEAMQGHVALYRVLSPQRATLMLDLHDDPPGIGELKTYHNANVREETVLEVEGWLDEAKTSTSKITLRR